MKSEQIEHFHFKRFLQPSARKSVFTDILCTKMGSHLGQRMLPAFCAMLLFYWCLYFQAVKNQSQTELVDEEAMSQIRKGHETMCVVLTSRHKNLDAVRAVWSTSDIKASMGGVPEAHEGSS